MNNVYDELTADGLRKVIEAHRKVYESYPGWVLSWVYEEGPPDPGYYEEIDNLLEVIQWWSLVLDEAWEHFDRSILHYQSKD